MAQKTKIENIEKIKTYMNYFTLQKEKHYKKRPNLFFIAFEGSDKVGKTTLLTDIDKTLKNGNFNTNFSNIAILKIKDKVDKNKFNMPLALFYEILHYRNINTFDIINKNVVIKDNYQDTLMIVLYDRYIESTLIYQILYYLANNLINLSEKDIIAMIDNIFISANYLIPDLTIGIIRNTKNIHTEYDEIQNFYDITIIDQLYEIMFEIITEYDKQKTLLTYTNHIHDDKERENIINSIVFRIFDCDKK